MQAVAIAPADVRRPVPVVVAEPVHLYRLGLVDAVERAEGFVVRAALDDLSSAIASVDPQEQALCVVAADLDDPVFSRISAARQTHVHLQFIVVLSQRSPLVDAEAALAAGVLGLVEFSISVPNLHAAMNAVMVGRTTWAPEVRARTRLEASAVDQTPALTRRERQVLALMGRGLGNRAIAATLFISENTVKNHVRRVHEKFGAHSRTEAVVRAASVGMVEISAADR